MAKKSKSDKKAKTGKSTGEVADLKRKLNKLRKRLKVLRKATGAEARPNKETGPGIAASPDSRLSRHARYRRCAPVGSAGRGEIYRPR